MPMVTYTIPRATKPARVSHSKPSLRTSRSPPALIDACLSTRPPSAGSASITAPGPGRVRRAFHKASRSAAVCPGSIAGDAVDDGVGGRETRPDPVVAGLAQHDPGDRRPPAADPADRPEGEAAAGRVVRAGLDADEPVVPEQCVGVP